MGKIIFTPKEPKIKHHCTFNFSAQRNVAEFPGEISEEEAKRLVAELPEYFKIEGEAKAPKQRNVEPKVKK